MARCMARMEAASMLIRSISFGETIATAHASASRSMMGRNLSRCRSVSFLLSLSMSHLKSGGSITAAAVTGPARHPRPASSHPASIRPSMRYGSSNYVWVEILQLALDDVVENLLESINSIARLEMGIKHSIGFGTQLFHLIVSIVDAACLLCVFYQPLDIGS